MFHVKQRISDNLLRRKSLARGMVHAGVAMSSPRHLWLPLVCRSSTVRMPPTIRSHPTSNLQPVEYHTMNEFLLIPRFRPMLLAASVISATTLGSVVASASTPESLLRAVPNDAVFSYFVAGPNTDAPDAIPSLGLAAFVIERAHDFGLLSQVDECTRLWLDALATLSDLLDYPHAVVLLDIRAAPRPDGGHQLTSLHAALIIRTNGDNARIEQRIQHLIRSYTNDENSTLSTHERDGARVFTLRDRRLPDWAELTWGLHGEHYIVAIGAGSFDRIVKTIADRSRSLIDDAWFIKAWSVASGDGAFLSFQIRFDAARGVGDDGLRSKIDRVTDHLGLGGVDRGLWTIGRHGRAVEAGAFLHRGDTDKWQPLTRHEDTGLVSGVISDEATWYVILDVEPRALLDTLSKAYLAAKSPDAQNKSRSFWRNVEERVGLSIDRDILAHLRKPIVSHDYPQHALHLPFLWTRFIAVEDSDSLRRNLDRLLEAAQAELAKEGPTQLRHDADGVWYLYFGITGPAVSVTNDWLIVSFSPDAVRKNVESLARRRVGGTATEPVPARP